MQPFSGGDSGPGRLIELAVDAFPAAVGFEQAKQTLAMLESIKAVL